MIANSLKRRVLLVDPSTDEREMYAEWFRREGLVTLQADNADDAYRMTVELAPEVVITELRLHGADNGLMLTRRLKRDAVTQGVRVVILSCAAPQGDETNLAFACDLRLMKPCLPQMLAYAVDALLTRAA